MPILVTGGAGYIGSHTVRALERQKEDVIVVDNLFKGHRQSVKDSPLIVGDLADKEFLRSVFQKYSIEAVIHFAALSLVGESVNQPDVYFRNNVAYTLNLLDVMKEFSVDKIVFSSTAAVYGEPESVPIEEDHPTNPTSPYGESKLFIEKIFKRYHKAFGLSHISLRYFNAAGADERGDIGEDHNPESHLIPIVLSTLLGKRDRVDVFGTDYPTPDGTCVRDYIHVTDLSNAHVLALNALRQEKKSTSYNLGNGTGFSVMEVIDTIEKVTGQKVPFNKADRRPGDPARLVADSKRITSELNWQPQYPELEKIVESAWQWHKNHPNGFPK